MGSTTSAAAVSWHNINGSYVDNLWRIWTTQPTVQEGRLLRAQQRAWRRQEVARAREADEARGRAETLLQAHLSPAQAESLTTHGWFEVTVAGVTYRIKRGHAGNVVRVDVGREVERYCIHPAEFVPDADAMLAQKLLLEADPAEFRRIANRTALP